MGGTHQQHCLSLCLLYDSLNCMLKVHTPVTTLYPIVSRDSPALIPVLLVPMMNATGNVGMDVLAGGGRVVIAVFTLLVMIMTHVVERTSIKHVVYYQLASVVTVLSHASL